MQAPVPVPRPSAGPQQQSSDNACLAALKAAHVDVRQMPPVDDPKGCRIDEPVELAVLPDGSMIEPPAILSCKTALAVALFLRDSAQQQAIEILGSTIKTIRQDSAYVCRPRNGAAKLSEHAFGRAMDIGAFVTRSGEILAVQAATDQRHAAFLDAVRKEACGPFSTVLGPGSDADHALHFHFDLAPRKGKPFCQ
jgi:hypothetical protein